MRFLVARFIPDFVVLYYPVLERTAHEDSLLP